jgi:anti-anti-sigma factor
MDLAESRHGLTLVLTPRGRLDGRSTPAFEERLLGCIAAGERSILLDCSALDYISSTGLRTVLTASKRLNDADGRFALCALNANLAEVFRISGFETIMAIHPDAATALATFA